MPDGPVVVRGWDAGLRMLVDNLVANAVLHGRRDGRVEVDARGRAGAAR